MNDANGQAANTEYSRKMPYCSEAGFVLRNPHTCDGPALGVNVLIRRALRTISRDRSR
jgi:hypothetical protein